MTAFRWLRPEALIILHDEGLAEHGGLEGIRDNGLLESAMKAPEDKAYNEDADVFGCAASYASSIVRNNPFFDGNKRAAFLACATFLTINGVELTANQAEATLKMLALAASEMSEAEFADGLRAASRPA